MIFFDHRQ